MDKRQQQGRHNPAFIGDNNQDTNFGFNGVIEKDNGIFSFDYKIPDEKKLPVSLSVPEEMIMEEEPSERPTWGNSIEFLMSCIAMSIGLGNVWRFPFTAYENGGGAFLIPYIIVLFLVGKPFYYLEMILGQFASRSSVKVWSAVPAFRGVGWAQMFSSCAVGTYYCSLMSITLLYLVDSFQAQLPWSTCLPEWGPTCVDSLKSSNSSTPIGMNVTEMHSSAELHFTKTVLNEKSNINDGIGLPSLKLTGYLFLSWLCIFLVLAKGVQSSGKAAYFLAIFPYIIMIALLIRSATLEGAANGILYFIKPDWNKLFEPRVWYAAVTQCFFSLSVCFGGVVMFSSYNNFRHNIYRDVIVVTTLDTFTSFMAGCTIFGILGNLAHELGTEDISKVVRGDTGLAFVSYPDAIAKFTVLPQLFSVLFFLMLFVLGIGSAVALSGGIIAIITDQFPSWKHWYVVLGVCLTGFCIGTIYCTPGGQFVLGLVDFFGASFIVFVLAILEMTGIFWIYGLENFLDDIEYMLKRRPSVYWRFCWGVVTPLLLTTILIYTLITLTPITYSGILYPQSAYNAGWCLLAFGLLQIPFWMLYTMLSKNDMRLWERVKSAFKPTEDWGPKNSRELSDWREFKEAQKKKRETRKCGKVKEFLYVVLGLENKLV